uniref:Uncharacterized protein n=1 Tax=Arundo donax TaxID=35708 RepID=A0A0A9GPW7_ARUDO
MNCGTWHPHEQYKPNCCSLFAYPYPQSRSSLCDQSNLLNILTGHTCRLCPLSFVPQLSHRHSFLNLSMLQN